MHIKIVYIYQVHLNIKMSQISTYIKNIDNSSYNKTAIEDTISTTGVYPAIYRSFYKNVKLDQCSYCGHYYKQDMVTVYNSEISCYHCIFLFNYETSCRKKVDGTYGMTIVQYIAKCKNDHDVDLCYHTSTCFICDYMSGVVLENVKVEQEYSDDSDVYTVTI